VDTVSHSYAKRCTNQSFDRFDSLKNAFDATANFTDLNQKSSAPRGGVWKSFARKPLVSIASLYFSPQGAGNYTHTRLTGFLSVNLKN
jgi:hypothetical protein